MTRCQAPPPQSPLEEVFRDVSLDDDGYSDEKTDTETEEEDRDRDGVRNGRKRSWSKSPTRAFVKNFP